MSTEDFSFPTTADLFPCGIDSPPLWRLSPAASPDHVFLDRKPKPKQLEDEDEDEEEDCFLDFPAATGKGDQDQERKSFSYVEESKKVVAEEDDDEEEKMDLLWENFNEELPRSRSSSKSSRDLVELGCVEALKLSKSNTASAMFAPRRPGMLVFMRVLRKLFLLHNSQQRSAKHHAWKTP